MTHKITLEFEDADSLRQALEFIGDSDAPVFLLSGTVECGGKKFKLWDEYDKADAHARRTADDEERMVALHTLAVDDHFRTANGHEYVVTSTRLSPTDKVRARAVAYKEAYPYPGDMLVVPLNRKEE